MNPPVTADLAVVNALTNIYHSARVTEDTARYMLWINMIQRIDGKIRYFQMKHLGLGIYEVRLLPENRKSTVLVEVWKTVENGL